MDSLCATTAIWSDAPAARARQRRRHLEGRQGKSELACAHLITVFHRLSICVSRIDPVFRKFPELRSADCNFARQVVAPVLYIIRRYSQLQHSHGEALTTSPLSARFCAGSRSHGGRASGGGAGMSAVTGARDCSPPPLRPPVCTAPPPCTTIS